MKFLRLLDIPKIMEHAPSLRLYSSPFRLIKERLSLIGTFDSSKFTTPFVNTYQITHISRMTMKHCVSTIALTLFAAIAIFLFGSLMNNAIFSEADAARHPCENNICEMDYESPLFGVCVYEDNFTCRMSRGNDVCNASTCGEIE